DPHQRVAGLVHRRAPGRWAARPRRRFDCQLIRLEEQTSTHLEATARFERQRLSKAGTLARFALPAVALAAIAGAFAYLGGWLTPNELTPAQFTDAFEQVDGVHPGFRHNHAKGVGVSGYFDSNGEGVRLSKAVVFRPGRVPVIGRFSLG